MDLLHLCLKKGWCRATCLASHGVIANDVSYYINLLVRIAHIICNHLLYKTLLCSVFLFLLPFLSVLLANCSLFL